MFFKRLVTAFQMLALLLASFTLALLFLKQPPAIDAPTTTAAPGVALFATNCASCHGANGDGGTAPRLAGTVVEKYPVVEDQLAVVRIGRGSMPAFGSQLSADEIRQIVDFTRAPPASPSGAGPAGTVDAKAIYKARCAGCHDDDGAGTYLNGVSFVGGSMKARYPNIDDEIRVVVQGKGEMSPFEGKLSPDEIKAVVEYTRTQL